MSAREIAKMFRFNCHKVVARVVDEAMGQNPNLGKRPTPESSISAVPMASTEDRSETREDARS